MDKLHLARHRYNYQNHMDLLGCHCKEPFYLYGSFLQKTCADGRYRIQQSFVYMSENHTGNRSLVFQLPAPTHDYRQVLNIMEALL